MLAADTAVFLSQKVASRDSTGEGWHYFVSLLRSPALWFAICLTPVQLWLWTRILRGSDIGWAYPATSLAYPITMAVAATFFDERYDWHVWGGALLITAGAAVLGPPGRTDARGAGA